MNYNGIPQGKATGICTPSTQQPTVVPLSIDWNVYWQALNNPESLGVNINLSGNSANGATLDRIRTIKIDNTFSSCPIYAYFPDTQDVVSCAPQTVVTLPVNTNAQNMVLYAQGLTAGFIPYTIVYLFNVALPSVIDPAVQLVFPQWQGSTLIQRSNILTPGYGPPILGDQTIQYIINGSNFADAGPYSTTIFDTPRASGKIYLQQLTASMIQFSSPGPEFGACDIIGSVSGRLYRFIVGTLIGQNSNFVCYSGNSLNIPLDATETWTMQATKDLTTKPPVTYLGSGFWTLVANFSYVE
jgi:hypothetical protein